MPRYIFSNILIFESVSWNDNFKQFLNTSWKKEIWLPMFSDDVIFSVDNPSKLTARTTKQTNEQKVAQW